MGWWEIISDTKREKEIKIIIRRARRTAALWFAASSLLCPLHRSKLRKDDRRMSDRPDEESESEEGCGAAGSASDDE